MKSVKGQLFFSKKVNGVDTPIRNATLQLWDLDVIKNDYLATGNTDMDGKFVLHYDPSDADSWNDEPDLVLRLMDREYRYDKGGDPVSDWYVVESFHAGNNITDEVFDFGVLKVAFWEYQNSDDPNGFGFTPRAEVIDGKTMQGQRSGRTLAQLQVGSKHLSVRAKHRLIAKFSPEKIKPTNKEIEKAYPEKGSTREIGQQAFSDDFISDLVLNGFNPQVLTKGDSDNSLCVDFNWNGIEQDGKHFSPNTKANFLKSDDGKLKLQSIEIQKRLGGEKSANALYRQPKLYTPQDPAWERVKRLFRCNYFLFGEVETHLSETHLNVEQYLVPIRRHLLENPVARLLLPHFYGTTAVNLAANEVLISPDGLVQKCSALTPDSVKHTVQNNFSSLNWYGWRPRKPIGPDHHFAIIGNLFWDVITDYVESFFAANQSAISQYWHEVHSMSNELILNALPYQYIDDSIYIDNSEINSNSKTHPRVNGRKVAITPVTGSDTANPEGMANLKQLCCYLLYHSTFKHSWVNDLQYKMGGEIEFATLGVNNDITNMSIDPSTVVPSDEALEHPFITYILNYTQYGYVLRNEDDDMNPELIKALFSRRNDFANLGYDIRNLRSCINT